MCLQKINRLPLPSPLPAGEKSLRRDGSSTHEILQAFFTSSSSSGTGKRNSPLDGHQNTSENPLKKKNVSNSLSKELDQHPLVQATRSSARSCGEIERLLDAGEDVNQTDSIMKNSSLHYSAFYNHLAIAKILVSRGADVNLANRFGITPLMWAIEKGHTSLVKFLLSLPELDLAHSDKQGFTALHKAVVNGNVEILREILSVARTRFASGIDFSEILNATSGQGLTAAHQAAYHGNAPVLRLLVQYGADLNVLSLSKTSPLHLASSRNHSEVARILVSQGVIVDQQDAHRRTPLHYACIFGHFDVASFLVTEARASVLLEDFQNNSPLSIVLRDGVEELSSIMSSSSSFTVGSPDTQVMNSPTEPNSPSPSLNVFDDLGADSHELRFFFVPSPPAMEFSFDH